MSLLSKSINFIKVEMVVTNDVKKRKYGRRYNKWWREKSLISGFEKISQIRQNVSTDLETVRETAMQRVQTSTPGAERIARIDIQRPEPCWYLKYDEEVRRVGPKSWEHDQSHVNNTRMARICYRNSSFLYFTWKITFNHYILCFILSSLKL